MSRPGPPMLPPVLPLLPEELRECGCGRDTAVFGHETCWTHLDTFGRLRHVQCEGCRACGCQCHRRLTARAASAVMRMR